MVLPRDLLERYRATFGTYANTVSRFEQQTLRRFLEEGYFARHLSRMRSAYKSRMEALVRALEESFGREAVRLEGRHNGLHLLLTLEGGPGEREMVAAARREGGGPPGPGTVLHGPAGAVPGEHRGPGLRLPKGPGHPRPGPVPPPGLGDGKAKIIHREGSPCG